MYAMSPEQMHRQVVRSQEQARRQMALERQAVKAHRSDTAESSRSDTVRTAFTAFRRAIASLRPRTVPQATAR